MTPLLEKIRVFKRRRKDSDADTAPPPKGERRRKRWTLIGVGLVVTLGLFFWLTSARLLMEPIRIDYGPLDPSFANAMGPITGADFTDGNTVETLVNGDGFFPPMLKAIREAQKTINLETYIWESGYISNLLIDALTERARAGVKVNALVTAWVR